MKKYILYIMILFCPVQLLGQGKTHHFLVGYNDIGDAYTAYGKGRLLINNTTIDTLGESRKMPFNATQGNISDENGNLLMASNGCWIADATGDTMQGGGGGLIPIHLLQIIVILMAGCPCRMAIYFCHIRGSPINMYYFIKQEITWQI